MYRIELSPNDKGDLLELLEYAKEKKKEDLSRKDLRDKWNDSKYWEIRIEQLKMVVNGYVSTPSIQSTMSTMNPSLKRKERLENDLLDFIDYMESKKDGENLY